jgi:hypothetical protein
MLWCRGAIAPWRAVLLLSPRRDSFWISRNTTRGTSPAACDAHNKSKISVWKLMFVRELCLCVRPGHLLHFGRCGLAALPVLCPHTTHLPESRRGPKGRPPSCGYHPWPASLVLVWHRLFQLCLLVANRRQGRFTVATEQHSSSAVGAQQPCLIGTGTCGSSDVLTTPVSALVSARISSVLPQRHPNARHDVCWCGVLSAPIRGWLPPHTVRRHLFLSACVLARCAWMHMARAKQPPPAVATA